MEEVEQSSTGLYQVFLVKRKTVAEEEEEEEEEEDGAYTAKKKAQMKKRIKRWPPQVKTEEFEGTERSRTSRRPPAPHVNCAFIWGSATPPPSPTRHSVRRKREAQKMFFKKKELEREKKLLFTLSSNPLQKIEMSSKKILCRTGTTLLGGKKTTAKTGWKI